MATGKGGLTIIDYPFAFSIGLLFFPTAIYSQDASALLTASLFGGIFGSILTIVNPVGFIINRVYEVSKRWTLGNLAGISKFVRAVIARNYDKSLKSPSISYETDILVGMFYFVIVLLIALYRLQFDGSFVTSLKLTPIQVVVLVMIVYVGFILVLISMVYHVAGWKRKSTSHLDRIVTVTVLLMAIDLTNLSLVGTRILQNTFRNDDGAIKLGYVMLKGSNTKAIRTIEDLKTLVTQREELPGTLRRINMQEATFYTRYWEYFLLVKELATRYSIDRDDALWWFKNIIFFGHNEFDPFISQLQSSIESRDWENAELQTVRILNRFDGILKRKEVVS